MPETLAIARQRGLRVVSEVELPPGQYQLRAVAADEVGNRIGQRAVRPGGARFLRSRLVNERRVADLRVSECPADGAGQGSACERATGAANDDTRVHARRRARVVRLDLTRTCRVHRPNVVDIASTVRAAEGRFVFEHREERSSTELQGASAGMGTAFRFHSCTWCRGGLSPAWRGARAPATPTRPSAETCSSESVNTGRDAAAHHSVGTHGGAALGRAPGGP